MALEFFESSVASPSGASDGVFIPVSDLPGVVAGELADAEPVNTKVAKALLGAFYGIVNNLPNNGLGVSASRATNSAGLDLTNVSFTISPQIYVDYENKTFDALPVPTKGSNNGIGQIAISDIFTNAEKVDSDGAISGEGFLIPSAEIKVYGSPSHANLAPATDIRLWLKGFAQWVSVDDSIPVRSGTEASAITSKIRSNANTVILPPAATDADNPTTGFESADLNKIAVLSHNFQVTIQVKLNQETQTFDTNVVTS